MHEFVKALKLYVNYCFQNCSSLVIVYSCVVEILVGQLFEGLRMDVNDVAQCSADFVCLRDIEV